MKKMLPKCMFVSVILVVGTPFLLQSPQGTSLASLNQVTSYLFLPFKSLNLNQIIPDKQLEEPQDTKEAAQIVPEEHIYYKWQDEKGTWQFTKLPPTGIDYKVLNLDPNANIIQALPNQDIQQALGTATSASSSSDENQEELSFPFPTTLPLQELSNFNKSASKK